MPDPHGRVDLRSDTVTRPTPAMRRAMAEAEVGDDGLGDDPTVARLEAAVAERLGHEAAVWVPTGTMANQVAVRVLTRPGELLLCGRRQHLVVREAGAAGTNAGAQVVTLDDGDGTLDPAEVARWAADAALGTLDPAEVARWAADAALGWAPIGAVAVEDTHGEAGGLVWPLERLAAVAAVGRPVHLDGARLWNAAVASGASPAERARAATTVTVCLSKGLGAPAGSVLCGARPIVAAARTERRRLGGALRQVGVLAAAGLVALERVDRLAEDHERARALAAAAARRFPGSVDPSAVATNIVRFVVPDPMGVVAALGAVGVLALPGSATEVRLVTHADLDDADVDRAVAALEALP